METRILNGRALAERLRAEVAEEIRTKKLGPGLGVVLVGDDPASHLYVGLKEKACREAGIRFEKRLFAADAAMKDVLDQIAEFNRRGDIDAILVQLPMPPQFDEDAVIAAINPEKDVDGFHPKSAVEPGIVSAIVRLIRSAERPVVGRRAVVLANSKVFAVQVAEGLRELGLSAEIAIDQPAAARLSRDADVVVIAFGRPGWLTKEKVKPGAVVIDVGTTRVGEKTIGDADFAGLQGTAGAITPVPGGIGPMTVAMLLKNTLELAERHKKRERVR